MTPAPTTPEPNVPPPATPASSPVPATASVLWSRWLALGWLVLFVVGCLAVAWPSPTLLERLDVRAAFRGEPPAPTVDAPGEE